MCARDLSGRVVTCDTSKKLAECRNRNTKSSLDNPLRECIVVHDGKLINFALQYTTIAAPRLIAEKHADQTLSELLIRVRIGRYRLSNVLGTPASMGIEGVQILTEICERAS
jgi:hypothetical protein